MGIGILLGLLCDSTGRPPFRPLRPERETGGPAIRRDGACVPSHCAALVPRSYGRQGSPAFSRRALDPPAQSIPARRAVPLHGAAVSASPGLPPLRRRPSWSAGTGETGPAPNVTGPTDPAREVQRIIGRRIPLLDPLGKDWAKPPLVPGAVARRTTERSSEERGVGALTLRAVACVGKWILCECVLDRILRAVCTPAEITARGGRRCHNPDSRHGSVFPPLQYGPRCVRLQGDHRRAQILR